LKVYKTQVGFMSYLHVLEEKFVTIRIYVKALTYVYCAKYSTLEMWCSHNFYIHCIVELSTIVLSTLKPIVLWAYILFKARILKKQEQRSQKLTTRETKSKLKTRPEVLEADPQKTKR